MRMITYLEAAKNDGWRHIVTGDESWFIMDQAPRRMWSLTEDEVATKPRTTIATKKFMYTIMWNPHGFHVIDLLPSDAKMNSTYYTSNVLEPLHQNFFPEGRTPQGKRLVVHVDNCSVHTSAITKEFMETHDMVSMPHPPYSPDLAPSDFYLFGTVKQRLQQAQFSEEDDFFEELDTILMSISKDELMKVFQSWLERVRAVSQGNGDYIS
jgi:transposase